MSDQKQHNGSVVDFCVLDSVPGENCDHMFEV